MCTTTVSILSQLASASLRTPPFLPAGCQKSLQEELLWVRHSRQVEVAHSFVVELKWEYAVLY